jgi:hypothetical protein
VERKAEIMAAAVDLIDDLDGTRRSVEPDQATVMHGRLQRQVPVLLRDPCCDAAVTRGFDLMAVRVAQPQEGPAIAGLALPTQLDCVVCDSGPEI